MDFGNAFGKAIACPLDASRGPLGRSCGREGVLVLGFVG